MPSRIAALFNALKPGSVPKSWRPLVVLAGTVILFAGVIVLAVSAWRQPLSGDLLAAAGLIIVTGLVTLWTGSDD